MRIFGLMLVLSFGVHMDKPQIDPVEKCLTSILEQLGANEIHCITETETNQAKKKISCTGWRELDGSSWGGMERRVFEKKLGNAVLTAQFSYMNTKEQQLSRLEFTATTQDQI